MRRIAIALLSATAILSAIDIAQARDGCGPGRYYNGYRCAPMGGPAYGPGPGYRGPGVGPGNRYIGNGMVQNWRGEVGCARPGFTVQDGVCKPYRGF